MSENNSNNSFDKETDSTEYQKIVFDTDEGKEEFYVLEQTMLGGSNYILVTDDLDGEEGICLILKEQRSEGDIVSYEIPEDESEITAVGAVFAELLEDFDLEV